VLDSLCQWMHPHARLAPIGMGCNTSEIRRENGPASSSSCHASCAYIGPSSHELPRLARARWCHTSAFVVGSCGDFACRCSAKDFQRSRGARNIIKHLNERGAAIMSDSTMIGSSVQLFLCLG
jgi:hypothetical protein